MTAASASWTALFQGPRATCTLLLTLGVGLHAIDVFIVATILPSVVADIGGAAFYAWSSMVYVVASILGTATGGLIKATLGMRRGYMTGTLVFLLGTVGCAIAPHMLVLLGARVVQGVGGGAVVALSYGMVSALYPEDLRPRVLSMISGVWGIAALFGPMVGGVFAEIGWWRGAFWMALPVGMVVMGLVWRALPGDTLAERVPSVPLLRLILLGLGVLCVAWSGQVASLALRLALMGSAGVWVILAFRFDARATHRLFPSRALSLTTPVGTGLWLVFLLGVTSSQISVFLPLVLQVLHDVSPLGAGYFYTLRSLAWTVFALWSAGMTGRAVRVATALGPLAITGGVLGQALVVVDGSLVLLGGFAVLTGIGYGLCFAHLSSWTMAAAPPGEGDRTASCLPTAQQLGIAFGAATAGLAANAAGLAADVSHAAVASAAAWVYGLSVVAPVLTVALSLRMLRLYR